MAGLDAVDRRVDVEQAVAVGLADLVVGEVLLRVHAVVLGEVLDDPRGQRGQVHGRGVVVRVGDAVGVGEVGVLHPQLLRLAIHHRHEAFLRAADRFGQRQRRVIARLHDQAQQQVAHAHRLVGFQEHARLVALDLEDDRGRHHGLVDCETLFLDCGERQVRGHQLGQRSRLDAHIGVLRSQGLAAGDVVQHPGLGRHLRHRHTLGAHGSRGKHHGGADDGGGDQGGRVGGREKRRGSIQHDSVSDKKRGRECFR